MTISMDIVPQNPQNETPARNGAPLADHHRHMLEVESGIGAREIAARACWTAYSADGIPDGFKWYQYTPDMFPILVIPQYNLTGRRFGYVLRPDNPRRSRENGKPIKYESQPGGRVGFDINPLMVDALRDRSVPLYITEGSKKADAAASRGVACISFNGVYGFMSRRVIVSELDEIETDGRDIRIVFDDDVMTKPGVADALDRLCGALDRRDAKVHRVILNDPMNPDTPPGEAKIGLDDYFVKGGTPDTLSRLSTPWRGHRRPTNVIDMPDGIDYKAEYQAVVELTLNPYLTHSEKVFLVQSGLMAMKAAARGKVDDEGRVSLTAGVVSRDFREKPERGESKAKVNPDGSLFLMPRSTAKSTAKKLNDDLRLITFRAEPVTIKRKNGAEYTDTGIAMVPPKSLAEYIRPAARYVPKEYEPRADYRKQEPCTGCGQVHPRKKYTEWTISCGGCGQVLDQDHETKTLPVPPASRPVDDLSDAQRERLDTQTTTERSKVTKNVTINDGPSPSPGISPDPGSHSSVTKNVTMPKNTDNDAETPLPLSGSKCAHKAMTANGWQHCQNPTGGRFYCDEHATPQEATA